MTGKTGKHKWIIAIIIVLCLSFFLGLFIKRRCACTNCKKGFDPCLWEETYVRCPDHCRCPTTSFFEALPEHDAPKSEAQKKLAKGDKLHMKGDIAGARKLYEEAIELDPNELEAYLRMGDIYLRLGDFDKCREIFEKALKIDPNNKFAHFGYANMLLEFGEFDEFLRETDIVIKMDPRFGSAYAHLGDYYMDSLENRDFKKSEESYLKGLEVDPNQNYPDSYLGLAELYYRDGKYQKALDNILRARKIDPFDIDCYMDAARPLIRLKRYQEAEMDLKKVMEIYPHRTCPRDLLCRLYIISGQYEKAEEWMNRIEEKYSRCEAVDTYRVWLMIEKGEYKKAQQQCDEMTKNSSPDPVKFLVLAHLKKVQGKNDEAEKIVKKVMAKFSDRYDIRDIKEELQL